MAMRPAALVRRGWLRSRRSLLWSSLALAAFPGSLVAQEPQLTPPKVFQDGAKIHLSVTLVGGFDDATRARIESGLPATFDYEIILLRDRKRWLDARIAERRLTISANYDAITREYLANFRLDDQLVQSRVLRSLAELERAMTEIIDLPVFDVDGQPRGERLLLRVRAVLGPRDGWLFFAGRDATAWKESSKFRLPRRTG